MPLRSPVVPRLGAAATRAEAVLVALTTPASLYKHCVRGDVLFLEQMYRSFLWARPAGAAPRQWEVATEAASAAGGGQESAPAHPHRARFAFRNSTALIEAALPAAARPLGFASGRAGHLPGGVDGRWFHTAPSGLSRLLLHVAAGEHAARAVRAIFEQQALVAFRHDFATLAAAEVNRSHACVVAALVLRMEGAAAALQLSSVTPAELWRECAALRAGARGPFWEGAEAATPRYAGHSSEWVPGYR